MKTPIVDFVSEYIDRGTSRFHMPGHKGVGALGCEARDITEIDGADVLYSAEGIIRCSEDNATELFGTAHTFFSTEGSTLCIKAMLAIAMKGRKSDTPPLVFAGRDAHKAFVYAAALLDFDIGWLGCGEGHICSLEVSAAEVDEALAKAENKPFAVYITSPNYLGHIADVAGIAQVCKRHGVPLLVDNAHGAYLAFMRPCLHPIALGAAMCADSAHKTLPVLTGGAYLHISREHGELAERARSAMSLFASTSPSYLILQSLDMANRYICDGYRERLSECAERVCSVKSGLIARGWTLVGEEPLKIVIKTSDCGYTGSSFAEIMRSRNIECEFYDEEYVVFMITPENTGSEVEYLAKVIGGLEIMAPISREPTCVTLGRQAMSVRSAMLAPQETVDIDAALGRVCAAPAVSCPPAVPIAVSGEVITEQTVALFKRYGIKKIDVVKY